MRAHLRSLLMVEYETTAQILYFRYYDPRVLRIYLPSCDEADLKTLFGAGAKPIVSRFWVESQTGNELIEFSCTDTPREENTPLRLNAVSHPMNNRPIEVARNEETDGVSESSFIFKLMAHTATSCASHTNPCTPALLPRNGVGPEDPCPC